MISYKNTTRHVEIQAIAGYRKNLENVISALLKILENVIIYIVKNLENVISGNGNAHETENL